MKLILQKNINENDYNEIVSICNDLKIDVIPFFRIPFSEEIPDDLRSDCFIYASSGITDKVYEFNKDYKGVFYHSNDLNIEELYHGFSNLMWNKNNFFVDNTENIDFLCNDRKYFIRPTTDDKFIAGTVIDGHQIKEWFNKINKMEVEKRFMISDLKIPDSEFRFFVVDKKIVSYSHYSGIEKLNDDVLNLADNFVNTYDKFPNYVFDIASDISGSGILEINSIHNSGFYKTDKKKIFSALKKYIDNKVQ